MKKLCLIDASAYIHRAFHAIPPLSTSKGEPVNAIYGFSRMISKVLKDEKPDLLGVCFDTAAPTFRHESYVEYKATRSELDPNLGFQLPLVKDLADAWGLPCVCMDGFEADDVIATLTAWGAKADMNVIIMSGDKDILQLVTDKVHVKDEIKKIEYDPAKVQERFGFPASGLIDYFCLTGDKVDNVLGVPGVGEKTASKLISEHKSLEGIYADMNGNSPSLKEKLIANKDRVFQNRHLIELRKDVPLGIGLDDLEIKSPKPELAEMMRRFEFRGDVFGIGVGAAVVEQTTSALTENTTRKVNVVMTNDQLKTLAAKLAAAKRISYDLETDSLDKFRCSIVGLAVSVEKDESWYIPVGHSYVGAPAQLPWETVKAAVGPAFTDKKILKCAQNMKFDNTILAAKGLQVEGPFFDTMVAAYCINPGRTGFGLKDLAADYLNERMTRIEELIGKGKDMVTFTRVPIEKAAPYAAADAEVTLRLMDFLAPKLAEENVGDLFGKLEMPLVEVIQAMEKNGILIDADYLRGVGKQFTDQKASIEKEIFAIAGEEFVLNSPKQLARILFEKLKLPPSKKTKTGFSTDEDVLIKLAKENPICEKIIACRELSKLSSTYVDSILDLIDTETGRVHTSFNQTGTITGRLSSTNPNLQNIPIRTENGRLIRKAFIASPGNVLVSADYSQIDLRSLAHMSGDPVLVKTFKAGGDVHAATASEMFQVPFDQVTADQRRSAKAINFGIVYGQQAFALAQSLGIPVETAREFINKYFERYAGVRAWIEGTLAEARKAGVVTTLAGRKRRVDEINAPNAFTRGFAERVAVNTPIQGTSADIIKFAMIRIQRELNESGTKTKMLVQVHDELLFDVPKAETKKILPMIRSAMEEAYKLEVPLVVDIKTGANWNDMTKV